MRVMSPAVLADISAEELGLGLGVEVGGVGRAASAVVGPELLPSGCGVGGGGFLEGDAIAGAGYAFGLGGVEVSIGADEFVVGGGGRLGLGGV